MSSGGGGNGTSQEVLGNWSPTMTGYWAGPNGEPGRGFLERAARESNKEYDPYTGRRVAPMHANQTDAIYAAGNVAKNGTNLANAGRDQVYNTSNGKYLQNSKGEAYNPFDSGAVPLDRQGDPSLYRNWAANNPAAQKQFVADKYNAGKINVGANDYAGMDSPYYQSLVNKGMKDITKNYQQGTQAQTQKMMNLAGVFGGGAHVAAEKNNQDVLAETLGDYAANMGNTQYDRSAGLKEADIGRRVDASKFDTGMDASSYGDWANRKGAASAGDIGRESDYFDRYVNRDLGAQTFNRGTDVGAWNSERGRQSAAGQFGSGNDQAAMNIYKDLYGFGANAQGQTQREDDALYNAWAEKNNWGKNQLGWLGNMLSQAQGTTGATSTTGGYQGAGVNPWAAALGTAAGAYGMFGPGK